MQSHPEQPITALQSVSTDAWVVKVKSPTQTTQQITLVAGSWLVGSSACADVVLLNERIAPQHLTLVVHDRGLTLRLVAQASASFNASGVTGVLQEGTDLALCDQAQASIQLGDFVLELVGPAHSQEAARAWPAAPLVAHARTAEGPLRSEGHGQRKKWWHAVVVLFALPTVALVAWASSAHSDENTAGNTTPTKATSIANASLPTAPKDLAFDALRTAALEQQVVVSEVGPPGSSLTLTGSLLTGEQCGAFARLRSRLASIPFLNQVSCLPDLAAELENFMGGTGLKVQVQGGGLVIAGQVNEAQHMTRLESALSSLPPSVSVDTSAVQAAPATTLPDSVVRQIRTRIVSLSPGDDGHVVTRNGDFVYVGGAIATGVELVSVEQGAVVVQAGQQRLSIQL